MKISRFVFNPFGENTYVVWDETTLRAAIIDPGMIDRHEEEVLDSFIEREHLKLDHMIFTHVHIDHTFGAPHVSERYGLKASANVKDAFLGLTRSEQARMFHLPLDLPPLSVDIPLREGDEIVLGPDTVMRVIEIPGHSPGSIALYLQAQGVVLTGDALFPGSVGRTDIPGGNHPELISSIREKLLSLPDTTVVLPGHGGETTIGDERRSNPFLR